MANVFTKSTKSSLAQSSTVTNETNTSTTFDVVNVPVSTTVIILSILISNKIGSSANANVYLLPNGGTGVYFLKNAPVPAGSSLEIVAGSKIIINASDIVRLSSDTASALDVTVSYLQQT